MDMESSALILDEDIATQFGIEQSLLEHSKQTDLQGYSGSAHRIIQQPSKLDRVLTAIRTGDEVVLRNLTTHQKAFSDADNRGWVALHEAASQSNYTLLEITFAASPRDAIHKRTYKGETPLFLSVEKGLIENASFLLDKGSCSNVFDNEETTLLVTAIRNNNHDMMKMLLCMGANVNQEGANQRTALHEAARLGKQDFVEQLLKAGAWPDPHSAYGLTPLALAAQIGHMGIVHTLLKRGADVKSQAQDSASILFEAAASGNAEVISLLLKYGADPDVPKHTGHLPIHRVAHRGHVAALALLIPVTTFEAVDDSGISPLHSAAAGGQTQCLEMLLSAGYDPNFMLHPWVRRNYDDQRKSALYFAVSNEDLRSVEILLEAGAMPNQDPVKCLHVALRTGNHDLINLLLRYGANVNYVSRVNPTHYPTALQHALKDELLLRMLFNYGYDVKRCFDCPYGQGSHVPPDYEGWSNTVIKDTMFCEVITLHCLKHLTGHVVRVMMDYVDHATFCSKLKAALVENKEWPDICQIQENVRPLQHLCRLRIRNCLGRLRLRAPVFMSFLPLPDRLKEYILYREYDLYGQRNKMRHVT
ncbi:dynein axonemal heavy chain 12 isoform X1 [Alosa alosa]|uniref:dynein heavy chain 12, axonemal isoform X1 n=2 Tax=Alosa sapidissima TaxID=34773 RepID=UPI001C0A4096|nr:dynein heavy chain 12, axonemal isoform X1 [Alosa sapidissima]XP_041945954.1 dynein heavy chain 12, axonemal isoform X1 [Alosa sapidissima]XP_041945955.1 dynein heavy chain 12, axonemal isoform X1 [Alosa sapidissima]XP_048109828.1 dynein axonemal heavy chain 12 isoform X1 [Alosa alosa]XP_048109829.1 dynein axonemal heavy chain 12 isoform X1 [Alosa alosa]XP_048109830.1 dynein axonemal heavy chain 12 isoform X1 [Alosa alosa]